MRSSTETLASALRVLAGQIQSPDDVPSLALIEAADRLDELEAEVLAKGGMMRIFAAECDAANAEVERLRLDAKASRAALYAALPFVEDCEKAPEYKPGYAKKIAAQVRAAIGEPR